MRCSRSAGSSLLATLLVLLSTAFAAAQQVRVCGTPEMSYTSAQAIQQELNTTMVALVGTTNQTLAAERLASSNTEESSTTTSNARTAAAAAKPATGINVKVYFHVLNSGSTVGDGNIPDSTVTNQIQVGVMRLASTCQGVRDAFNSPVSMHW